MSYACPLSKYDSKWNYKEIAFNTTRGEFAGLKVEESLNKEAQKFNDLLNTT